MLRRTIAHLMEFNTLVQLLVETLAGSAVRRMESGIVTICAAATTYLAITVRTGKTGIEHYLLQALSVFPFEISDEGIVPFPIRESILMKIQ